MAQKPKTRINNEIRNVKEVRVINSNGQQLGVMSVAEALRNAEKEELDLVEIVPNAKPPVCKIIDFGKYVYEQQKREKLQKKKQHVTVLKEIRLHPNTDTHDFNFKVRHAKNFIGDGNKVKVAVIFKGRELAYKQHGQELLQRFIDELEEIAKVENAIRFEGRTMHAILVPMNIKKKK